MKSTFSLVGLALVFIAVAATVTYVVKHAPGGEPMASSTPKPTPLADDMIILDEPLPDALVTSPLKVKGRARGTWFFEASFPVSLTDWDGRIIAEVPAQATAEWMTTDFVPFEATLTFDIPAGPGADQPNRGFLILKKDNPSGLPEHDDHREIQVFFRK